MNNKAINNKRRKLIIARLDKVWTLSQKTSEHYNLLLLMFCSANVQINKSSKNRRFKFKF